MGKDDNLDHRAEQSNPFSTGGGGVNYEVCVQSYFVTSMLLEWKIPNIKAEKIENYKVDMLAMIQMIVLFLEITETKCYVK